MMNKRHDDKQKGRIIVAAFTVAALILLFTCLSMPVKADQVIEFDNGYNMEVPVGWEVSIYPKGFNLHPYDSVKNPKGKLPGWGGWPKYTEYLEKMNCHPGELVISPSVCPPQPRFVKPYTQCYFEPIPQKEPEGCLVISPSDGSECSD